MKKQRVWVTRPELDRVKNLIHAHLGQKSSVLIPFDAILPILEKPEITRLIWCRTARTELDRWGIKLGLRHQRQAYRVVVQDRQKWRDALSGLVSINEPDQKPIEDKVEVESSPELQHLIPNPDPHYVFPEWAEHLKISLQHGSKVLLSGPAGCGKTSLVRELAARQRLPFLRINLNGETSVADLLGSWKIQGRDMVFRYGPVALACRYGATLCLDELDAALPAVLFALQGILEEGGSLHIPDTNEWIEPHKDFRLVATANTVGKGDDSGLYAGTQTLNEAFLDRFHCVFQTEYLPAEQETRIICSKIKGIDPNIAQRMVHVADELRRALKEGIIYSTFSTRKLLAWASKTIQLGSAEIAARYTVLNKLSPDDQRVVREILQRHGFGGLQ